MTLEETLATRFWAKVERRGAEECWRWTASLNSGGYGQIVVTRGHPVGAHRISWELAHGVIPDGQVVDHLCHTLDPACPGGACAHRTCVNPAHLELVTLAENKRRGRGGPAANARKELCKRGHPFSLENTRIQVRPDGSVNRGCRTCIADAKRRRSRKEH